MSAPTDDNVPMIHRNARCQLVPVFAPATRDAFDAILAQDLGLVAMLTLLETLFVDTGEE